MGLHILVVDDSAELRLLVTHILEREGYEVTVAGSGAEALERVRERVPDLIVSDIMMPEMSGYQLLEQLRADPRLTAVPVVFLSALGDATSIERGRRLGVDHYLVKPFTPQQVLSTVSGTLRRYAQLRRAELIRQADGIGAAPSPPDFEPTGVGPIDEQVGGLCRGRVYLAIGGVGGGKSVLTVQLLQRALASGDGALLVTTDRLDTVLYVGESVGLDLRPHVRSGRLMVLGLADRFEYALETRDDVVGLAEEIAGHAASCGAARIVVSSILTVLCSAPRLVLSAPLVADLVGGLERTGATTVLVGDEAVTAQEQLAEAYLKRTTFGTIVLARDDGTHGRGLLRLERIQGVSSEPAGLPFRIAFGAGLVTVDPSAEPHVYDALDDLRRRVEVEMASAEDGDDGLAPLRGGGLRLRDPFALFLHECVSAALKVTERCALVVLRFSLRREAGGSAPSGPVAAPRAADLEGVLAGQEILCWVQPSEVVVLALGADPMHARGLTERLRRWIETFAAGRQLAVEDLRAVAAAYPADGTGIDALLDALGRRLARADETRVAAHAVA